MATPNSKLFSRIALSVDAYRRAVDEIERSIRPHHDAQAVQQLVQWTVSARTCEGNHPVLLQLLRDGVHVPLRPGWKESASATLSVFDRCGKRMGTIYLGEVPRKDQLFLTRRLDTILKESFTQLGGEIPVLRYVTDAGALPQSYYKQTLSPMKHPSTGEALLWSWSVDFFHVCEYATKIADAIFGTDSAQAHQWARDGRHVLRDEVDGVSTIIRRAAQQERRYGLKGKRSDFDSGMNYLKNYGPQMDYAQRRALGHPIGSGSTEAGCKVIFNQRFKQSGMRWNGDTMQSIINLRTACRSRIWTAIWRAILSGNSSFPPIKQLNELCQRIAA